MECQRCKLLEKEIKRLRKADQGVDACAILSHWNSQSKTIHHRRWEPKGTLLRIIKRYSMDEIKLAIDRYNLILMNEDGRYRRVYSWTLTEFLRVHDGMNLERLTAEHWEAPFLRWETSRENLDQHLSCLWNPQT